MKGKVSTPKGPLQTEGNAGVGGGKVKRTLYRTAFGKPQLRLHTGKGGFVFKVTDESREILKPASQIPLEKTGAPTEVLTATII